MAGVDLFDPPVSVAPSIQGDRSIGPETELGASSPAPTSLGVAQPVRAFAR